MKIAFFSRSWPSHENSGVSLIAYAHAEMLQNSGNDIDIFGSDKSIENVNFKNKHYIPSSGTGSLYSPSQVDRKSLRHKLVSKDFDLVIVEAWQTAITDAAIEEAYKLKIPVLVISHGISLHPFSNNIIDILRSWGWLYYRYIKFPRLIEKISSMSTLNLKAKSLRFFDRDQAIKQNKYVFELSNYPINFSSPLGYKDRKNWILSVGYFSRVKNQKKLIKLFSKFYTNQDIKLIFIGPKIGRYYEECVSLTKKLNLLNAIIFYDDKECNISDVLSKSKLVSITSITEVQPVIICEALTCGTPVIAPPVGAISEINSVIKCIDDKDYINSFKVYLNNKNKWEEISESGLIESKDVFNKDKAEKKLVSEVKKIIKSYR